MSKQLTHIDDKGRLRMVDVSDKSETERVAVAHTSLLFKPETFAILNESKNPKGEVYVAARLAGVMAAKRTAELIPLCHPVALSSVEVDLNHDEARNIIDITATCKATGQTGVEMEALTAASVAALTVYDMCKAVDRSIVIGETRLMHKSGGKSGQYTVKPNDTR